MIRVLGMMTGTSCDGLDAACLEFDQDGWQPCWEDSTPYPPKLRKRVIELQKPSTRFSLRELYDLHAQLGDWYGKAAKAICARHKIKPHLIANHGQTIGHFPAPSRKGTTVQLGDPSRISYATGLTVISHFRDGDIAAGGQGAPLVPLFHRFIASRLAKAGEGIAIHNIGGISNLTYISPQATRAPLAFDTGPGNIWIDLAAEEATQGRQAMDRGGRLAERGVIDIPAVTKILKHPYFARRGPKSTGRDDFPFELLLKTTRARDESLVATATAVTVESIGRAYEREILDRGLPLSRVFVCGGGARNPVLMRWLSERLEGLEFADLQSFGLDPQYIEAQAFAVFGYLSLRGTPLGGEWTGVNPKRDFAPPGQITPGKNWAEIVSLL